MHKEMQEKGGHSREPLHTHFEDSERGGGDDVLLALLCGAYGSQKAANLRQ